MNIPLKVWEKYRDTLKRVNKAAFDDMLNFLQQIGGYGGHEQEVIEYAYALATQYGEAAAACACEMYDAVAKASGVIVPPAEPAATATYTETAIAVRGSAKQSEQVIPSAVSRLTKMAGADTTLKNATRDGAQFAWIPFGDTCAFCRMLASRGWQNISKRTLRNGHAEHIHGNCDCQYATSFTGGSEYKFYDPDKYLEEYENASDGKWKDKLNAMRRSDYAAQEPKTIRTVEKKAAIENKYGKEINFEKTFTDQEKFKDSRKCITSLSQEYNTRLETVGTGAKNAGGDVDMSGASMRLSSAEPTTAIHEFAHTLANSSAEKYGLTNDSDFWKEIKKIRRAYHKDVDADGDTRRWISSYEHSSKSIDEFMAEAFTHAKAKELGYDLPSKYGNDFKYSRQVLEIINKYFKK